MEKITKSKFAGACVLIVVLALLLSMRSYGQEKS